MHDIDRQFAHVTAPLVADPVFRWRCRWARAWCGVRGATTVVLIGFAALGVTYLGNPGVLLDDVALGFRSVAVR